MTKDLSKTRPTPIKFMVDGEELAIRPLSLGALLFVEKLKKELRLNRRVMGRNPLLAVLQTVKKQPKVVRKIVAAYCCPGEFCEEAVVATYEMIAAHCDEADLATLLVVGSLANRRWLHHHLHGATIPELDEKQIFTQPLIEIIRQ